MALWSGCYAKQRLICVRRYLSGLAFAAVVTVIIAAPAARAQTVFNNGIVVDNGLTVTSGGANITGLTFSSGDIFTSTGNIFSNTGDVSSNTGNITTNSGAITTNTGDIVTNTGNITTLNGTVSGPTLSDTAGTTITGGVVTANDVQSVTGTYSGLLTVGAGLSVTGGVVTAPTANIATVNSGTTNTTTLNATTGNVETVNSTTIVNAGTTTTGTLNATTTNSATVNSTTIHNSGTTTTQTLAVGSGGVTVAAGVPVSFGGNRVQNVAAPVAATDAANKGYVDAGLGSANARIDQAFRDTENNTEGVAIAIALGGIALPHDKNFAIAGNIGFFDDKQALAAQAAVRLDGITAFNAGIGVGLDNNKVGGRIGLMAAW